MQHWVKRMDIFSREKRSEIMSRIHSRDTKPERYAKAALWANGFRFARSFYGLPGKPDIILPKHRTLVFVQGCFWHGHHCPKASLPTSNREFWSSKITQNKKRDLRIIRSLRRQGWHCFQVWQCRLSTDVQRVVTQLRRIRGY
jgi:DNA mismatch endonuclease (patch repair protein)